MAVIMKWSLIVTAVIFYCNNLLAQNIILVEFGAEPAQCRTAAYQSGNGVVYAYAVGGLGELNYEWENVQNGANYNGTTWGGLNIGWYKLTVTDVQNNSLVDSVYVDSINPQASFVLNSSGFTENNGVYSGIVPLAVNFINTSQDIMAYPGFPPKNYSWSFDGINWSDSLEFYGSDTSALFTNAIYTEVCLAYWNKNSCADTTCVQIELDYPSSYSLPDQTGNVFVNQQNRSISVVDLPQGQYQLQIHDTNGNLETSLSFTNELHQYPVDIPQGLHIGNIVNTNTGASVSQIKFLF